MSKTKALLGTGTLIAGVVFSSSFAFAQSAAPVPHENEPTFNSTSNGVMLTAARNDQAYLVTTTPDTKITANHEPHFLADIKDAFGIAVASAWDRNTPPFSAARAMVYLPRSKL